MRGKFSVRYYGRNFLNGRNEFALENFGVINKKGGRVIAKRTRSFAYTFRVSEQEKNLIDEKIAKSGLTMREFILRSITDKPIIVIERSGEILVELKRQGNNLNQTVRNGYYGMDTEREIKNCIAYLKELYRKISVAVGG